MHYDSLWKDAKTFFPLLVDFVETNNISIKRALLIGASDGKFLIPLSSFCGHVDAIEIDEKPIKGGTFNIPDQGDRKCEGLIEKCERRGITNYSMFNLPFQAFTPTHQYDLVFTSCSWHYSLNKNWGVKNFIQKMWQVLNPNGIFCAEYMMPIENWHFNEERYLQEGQLAHILPVQYAYLFYTEPFLEKGHVYVPQDHFHKMGFALAQK